MDKKMPRTFHGKQAHNVCFHQRSSHPRLLRVLLIQVVIFASWTLVLAAEERISTAKGKEFDSSDDHPTMMNHVQKSKNVNLHEVEFERVVAQREQWCPRNRVESIKKGQGNDPHINWDDPNRYDPTFRVTARHPLTWIFWSSIANCDTNPIFNFTTHCRDAWNKYPEGMRAFQKYMSNNGADWRLTTYRRAYDDDSSIRKSVDEEIASVLKAVELMHNGRESTFNFHSVDSREVHSHLMNWKLALGGHRIWSTGVVTYQSSSCSLKVDLKIHVEDRYNFNSGTRRFFDISQMHIPFREYLTYLNMNTTHVDTIDIGEFGKLGWAKAFTTRGSIPFTKIVPLECCRNSDCPPIRPANVPGTCECHRCPKTCVPVVDGVEGYDCSDDIYEYGVTRSYTCKVKLFQKRGSMFLRYYFSSYTYGTASLSHEGSVIWSKSVAFMPSGQYEPGILVRYGSASSLSTTATITVDATFFSTDPSIEMGSFFVVAYPCDHGFV